MRIDYRVALVGGIPISIAAAIAIAAWFLLDQAERTRDGAVLAGNVYRNLLIATSARDEYVNALPAERVDHARRFTEFAERAQSGLSTLAGVARKTEDRAAAEETGEALARYVENMRRYQDVTVDIDRLVAEMATRAETLINLTDRARERQQASNAEILTSLTEGDRKLRFARDVVDRAHELRAAIASVSLQQAALDAAPDAAAQGQLERQLTFGLSRLRNAAADLGAMLRAGSFGRAADELTALVTASEARVADLRAAARSEQLAPPDSRQSRAGEELVGWADRVLKVNSTEQRALHDEVAQLLTYSVQANETEQATQNIALAVMKLGRRAAEAFDERDPSTATELLADSRNLAERVAALPISPLIQSEVIDTILGWRDGLGKTALGLDQQNKMIADMDLEATAMTGGARALNDRFAKDADTIGDAVRDILVIGATMGLLLGSGTALVVARSITRPLRRLQQGMLALAANPGAALLPEANRRDELGHMARAANQFVTEIGRREEALRSARDRADTALTDLRKAQADLIQSEKLASLGQLVAGVAHEINTPLGIALTSATLLGDEVQRLRDQAAAGRMAKSEFARFVEKTTETSQLLHNHLARAADLVHSFKQVATDQASGERRTFKVETWLQELIVSLSPLLRKAGHVIEVECREGLVVNTYPGALAQVLTNLVMNTVVHAYPEDRAGRMVISVTEPRRDILRIRFEDDGRGIAKADQLKVFDPFFTTGRSRGSTGLGLHIVYNLVTGTLGGRVELDSEPGRGTRFTIEFPKQSDRSRPAAAA